MKLLPLIVGLALVLAVALAAPKNDKKKAAAADVAKPAAKDPKPKKISSPADAPKKAVNPKPAASKHKGKSLKQAQTKKPQPANQPTTKPPPGKQTATKNPQIGQSGNSTSPVANVSEHIMERLCNHSMCAQNNFRRMCVQMTHNPEGVCVRTHYELHHHPQRWGGESLRMIFKYAGPHWVNHEVVPMEWLDTGKHSLQNALTYNVKLPAIEMGHDHYLQYTDDLNQMLGVEFDLPTSLNPYDIQNVGSSIEEMINDIEDTNFILQTQLKAGHFKFQNTTRFDPAILDAARNKTQFTILPNSLPRLEKVLADVLDIDLLQDNYTQLTTYFFSKSQVPSWVDFMLGDFYDQIFILHEFNASGTDLNGLPLLKLHYEQFIQLPAIDKHMKTRAPSAV